jgi:hypothetical protein
MVVGTGSRVRRGPRITEAARAQVRVWSRVLGTAAGVGALSGAGQLGVAYGLGMVRFPRQFPTGGLWATHLTWVAWFAVLAVLAGAAGGVWMARRMRGQPGAPATLGFGQRIMIATLAGVGAALTIGLTALPARAAEIPGTNPAPVLESALAATLGVVAGILAAVAALSLRVVAVSAIAIGGVMWLIALVSVAPSLGPAADPPLVRLGVLDLPTFGAGARSTVAVLSPLVLVLLVGVALASAARSRGLPALHTILAGAAGPAMLAVPYLIAAPGAGDRSVQAPAFGGALVALAAGVLAAGVVGFARLPATGPGPSGGSAPDVPGIGRVPAGMVRVPDPSGPGDPAGPPPWETPPAPPASPPARANPSPSAPPPAYPEPPREPEPPAAPPPTTTPPASSPPDDPPVAPPAEPATPAAGDRGEPGDAAGAPKKRRRRHHEEEHVDWVRSLGGGEDTEDDTGLGKRRLRLDKNALEIDDTGAFEAPPVPSTRRAARDDPWDDDPDEVAPRPYLPPDSPR